MSGDNDSPDGSSTSVVASTTSISTGFCVPDSSSSPMRMSAPLAVFIRRLVPYGWAISTAFIVSAGPSSASFATSSRPSFVSLPSASSVRRPVSVSAGFLPGLSSVDGGSFVPVARSLSSRSRDSTVLPSSGRPDNAADLTVSGFGFDSSTLFQVLSAPLEGAALAPLWSMPATTAK